MSQPTQPQPQQYSQPPPRRLPVGLIIVGALLVLAPLLGWGLFEGGIEVLIKLFMILFGGLAVLTGVALLAVRRR